MFSFLIIAFLSSAYCIDLKGKNKYVTDKYFRVNMEDQFVFCMGCSFRL